MSEHPRHGRASRIDRRGFLRLGLGAATATFAALAAVRLDTGAGARAGSTTRPALPTTPDANPPAATPRASALPPATARPRTATEQVAPSTTDRSRAATTTPVGGTTTPVGGTTSGQQPAPPGTLQFFGPAAGRAVYLTVDDGWFPDPRVLDLVRAEHLPITTFLIRDAANDDPEHFAFWRAFVDAGGQVQNHTVSHPWLTQLAPGQIEAQWEGASAAFRSWFGTRPTLGRPPYGAVDDAVWRAAANAGLSSLVMWSALDNGEGLQTWDHARLAPGEIVLLHWDPGLHDELCQVLAAVEVAGLVPRSLPA